MPTVKEKNVEDAAKEMEEFAALAEELDLDDVDLEMPDDFRDRVAANQRMLLVRDANVLKWKVTANKIMNPEVAKALGKELDATVLTVAIIDKKYINAKALSKSMMERAAAEEIAEEKKNG